MIYYSSIIQLLQTLPLLRYQKEPANTLQELYARYPLGGEFGWYAVVQEIGSFAYWSISTQTWESMTISPENLAILSMKMKYVGEWSTNDSYNFGYSKNDLVCNNNSIFVNIKAITAGLSIDISNTEYWKCLYDANAKVDKEVGKGLSSNDYDDEAVAEVAKIENKVDKEVGKGLSKNDFSDSYKAIVDSASSKSDLNNLKLNLIQLINSTLTEKIEVLQNQINTTPASQEIDTNFLLGENGEYVFDEKGNHVTLSNDSKSFLVIESGEFILFNNNKITL